MARILTGRTDEILARIAAFEGDELAARELDIPVADKDGKRWFVAVGETGETLGFCSAIDEGHRVGFWTFYVPPASRGTGVGRELWLARLDAYARRELYAYCSRDSWPFYERSGFEVVKADYEKRDEGRRLVWWAEVRRPA